MISISNQTRADCCGCNACGDVCSHQAISFETDIEGFWYPLVDKERCAGCGLCDRVCPVINAATLKRNGFSRPECHAAISKDIMTRFASTSGGMFTVLANQMYRRGGYVGGAIFDETWMVSQYISNDKHDLEKIRGSKLHQSDACGFYGKVQKLLKGGEQVLVCGTPCQMAALRAFLGKEYDNLIIVDFICRGINSPKVFRKWLDSLEQKHGAKAVRFRIKNKELGWRQLTTKVEFENGTVLYDTKDTNLFTIGYLQTGVYTRPSCYSCKFKGFPRIADITIGDFWGAEKYVGKDLDDDLGTSIVLLNNEKGKAYYDACLSKLRDKEVVLDDVVKGNAALLSPLNPPTVNRQEFYRDLNAKPFSEVADKYIKGKRELSFKSKLKNIARFLWGVKCASGFDLFLYWKNLRFNLLKPNIHTNICNGCFLIITKHTVLDIDKHAAVNIGGAVRIGSKRIKGSKLETRILVERDATLDFKGSASISYGADIEVFNGAHLSLGNQFVCNISWTCICGQRIEIGDNVAFGRECMIRDNNGGHYISRRGFKNCHPIRIGQHCWITEGSVLMPGAALGVGVIVGAKSVVRSSIPAFTMAMGHPAEVVDEEVYFKL